MFYKKSSQNSQENICVGLFFKKSCRPQAFSFEFCKIFKNNFFYRAPPGNCFCSFVYRASDSATINTEYLSKGGFYARKNWTTFSKHFKLFVQWKISKHTMQLISENKKTSIFSCNVKTKNPKKFSWQWLWKIFLKL